MEDIPYYIYKLEIGDYFYFGSSKDKDRLSKHKYNCYNPNYTNYNYKVYRKIRELCPNPNNFYDFVDFSIYHENLNIELKKYMENHYLQKHNNNPYCLNSDKSIFKHGETLQEYRKRKLPCSICNVMISSRNLSRHKKTIHN